MCAIIIVAVFMIPVQTEGCSSASPRLLYVTAVYIEGIMSVNSYVCAVTTVAVFMIPVQTEGCSSASFQLLFICCLTEILIS